MRASAAALVVLLAASNGRAEQVEVVVRTVRLDPESGAPVVQLREKTGSGRELPIWIGPFEAQAIVLELQHLPPGRPQTHDLMKELVERLGGHVRRVVIEDLREGTYFSHLELTGPDGGSVSIDARPSDAIALALRSGGQIYVEDQVFVKGRDAGREADVLRIWGLTVQDLTPELARFFDLGSGSGALVSDVAAAAPARAVARGDVITALDGAPVESAADLVRRGGERQTADPVSLELERQGKRVTVTFDAR